MLLFPVSISSTISRSLRFSSSGVVGVLVLWLLAPAALFVLGDSASFSASALRLSCRIPLCMSLSRCDLVATVAISASSLSDASIGTARVSRVIDILDDWTETNVLSELLVISWLVITITLSSLNFYDRLRP